MPARTPTWQGPLRRCGPAGRPNAAEAFDSNPRARPCGSPPPAAPFPSTRSATAAAMYLGSTLCSGTGGGSRTRARRGQVAFGEPDQPAPEVAGHVGHLDGHRIDGASLQARIGRARDARGARLRRWIGGRRRDRRGGRQLLARGRRDGGHQSGPAIRISAASQQAGHDDQGFGRAGIVSGRLRRGASRESRLPRSGRRREIEPVLAGASPTMADRVGASGAATRAALGFRDSRGRSPAGAQERDGRRARPRPRLRRGGTTRAAAASAAGWREGQRSPSRRCPRARRFGQDRLHRPAGCGAPGGAANSRTGRGPARHGQHIGQRDGLGRLNLGRRHPDHLRRPGVFPGAATMVCSSLTRARGAAPALRAACRRHFRQPPAEVVPHQTLFIGPDFAVIQRDRRRGQSHRRAQRHPPQREGVQRDPRWRTPCREPASAWITTPRVCRRSRWWAPGRARAGCRAGGEDTPPGTGSIAAAARIRSAAARACSENPGPANPAPVES